MVNSYLHPVPSQRNPDEILQYVPVSKNIGTVPVPVPNISNCFLPVIAECADNGRPVLADGLGPRLGRVILHEGEVGRLLALRLRIKHPGEAQLRVEPTEETVKRRGGGLRGAGVRRRGGRVDRDGRVAGGGLRRDPRGMGVRFRPGSGF
jgi:hypothetical protein